MPVKKTVIIALCCLTVLIFALMFIFRGVTSVEMTFTDEAGQVIWSYRSTDRTECNELVTAVTRDEAVAVPSDGQLMNGRLVVTFSFLTDSVNDFVMDSPTHDGKLVIRNSQGDCVMSDETKAVFQRFIEAHSPEKE
ncbi:MAG: hypothetical protein KIG36_01805 [Eubacteriales bacterium]|nr:hypothetical protein [Eubacteriales bacterium]